MSFKQPLLGSLITLGFYFSGFFIFLTPLPLFYHSVFHSKKVWGASLCLIVLFSFLIYGGLLSNVSFRLFSLSYLSFYLLIALFLSVGVFKRWPLLRWGFRSAVGVTAIVFFIAFLSHLLGWIDIEAIIKATLSEASTILDQMIESPKNLERREEMLPFVLQMKEWILFLPNLIPSFIFIFTIFIMAFNISVVKLLTAKKSSLSWTGRFFSLQIPHVAIWVLIASGLAFFLDFYFLKTPWLKVASLNILFVAAFAYFIQGLSLLAFFLKRFSPLFRLTIYGLVLLFLQVLGVVLVALGIADIWFDFRKLQRVKREE